VRNNESELAALLISRGASVQARDIYGDQPLHELSFYSSKPQTADVLLRAGADINARNMSGQTTLFKAVAWQRFDCVMYLVEHHANINIPDKSGATPLDIACRIDNHAIIDYLRRHGARHAANSWEEISPSARKVG
jgi:ankyrin repeat protein